MASGPPKVVPLSLATLNADGGMGRDVPSFDLPDNMAYTIFDFLMDEPGFLRMRGPLATVGTGHSGRYIGMARVQDPNGTEQVIKLVQTTTPAGAIRGVQNASLNYAWPYTPSISPYELFDAKDALNGGTLIGTAPSYDNPSTQAIALWRGAGKDAVGATTLASTINVGDGTVSLSSGGSSFAPGHFIFNVSGQLVGVVKSVSGNTLTLDAPALVSGSTSVTAQPFRGVGQRVATGRITTSSTSATVNGGLTKFLSQGLNTGTWDLYTPGLKFIGTVSAVASDTQLTLAANAAVSLTNSDYIAIRRDSSYALTAGVVGWQNCQYASHQFYASGNVLRFSSDLDPEAVDRTQNGDFLTFSADPIRGLVASQDSLTVLTEKEAYALVGAVGTTPDRWRGERILDDGTLCGMSAKPYKTGVIWAGRTGIWYYDGADPVNIAAKLGDDYRRFVNGATRAYGMIVRDHYLCYIEGGVAGVFAKIKNQTQTDYTRLTICINLTSGAISLLTNVNIRGAVTPPTALALGTSLFGVSTSEPTARTMSGDTLFGLTGGLDAYTCEGDVIGPDWYLNTKKYHMGDPQRLKLFKMFLLHYLLVGSNISLDMVKGLDNVGVNVASTFGPSSTYTDKRVKSMNRSQFLAVRLYQTGGSATLATLGPWAIGFKWKRPGRV